MAYHGYGSQHHHPSYNNNSYYNNNNIQNERSRTQSSVGESFPALAKQGSTTENAVAAATTRRRSHRPRGCRGGRKNRKNKEKKNNLLKKNNVVGVPTSSTSKMMTDTGLSSLINLTPLSPRSQKQFYYGGNINRQQQHSVAVLDENANNSMVSMTGLQTEQNNSSRSKNIMTIPPPPVYHDCDNNPKPLVGDNKHRSIRSQQHQQIQQQSHVFHPLAQHNMNKYKESSSIFTGNNNDDRRHRNSKKDNNKILPPLYRSKSDNNNNPSLPLPIMTTTSTMGQQKAQKGLNPYALGISSSFPAKSDRDVSPPPYPPSSQMAVFDEKNDKNHNKKYRNQQEENKKQNQPLGSRIGHNDKIKSNGDNVNNNSCPPPLCPPNKWNNNNANDSSTTINNSGTTVNNNSCPTLIHHLTGTENDNARNGVASSSSRQVHVIQTPSQNNKDNSCRNERMAKQRQNMAQNEGSSLFATSPRSFLLGKGGSKVESALSSGERSAI